MMTQALLTLPLDTEVSWEGMDTTGTVVAIDATGLITIRWADGPETVVANLRREMQVTAIPPAR